MIDLKLVSFMAKLKYFEKFNFCTVSISFETIHACVQFYEKYINRILFWFIFLQAILRKSSVSVEIEVRPRQLVPDTNCFIDYLPQLQCITKAISGAQPFFTLMVPLVGKKLKMNYVIVSINFQILSI